MGLCLYVFAADLDPDDEPEEIAECDLGPYHFFDHFRNAIAQHLEARRYPVLMEHSNSDGEWTLAEIPALEQELRDIAAAFKDCRPNKLSTTSRRQPVEALNRCMNVFRSVTEICLKRCSSCAGSPDNTNGPLRLCEHRSTAPAVWLPTPSPLPAPRRIRPTTPVRSSTTGATAFDLRRRRRLQRERRRQRYAQFLGQRRHQRHLQRQRQRDRHDDPHRHAGRRQHPLFRHRHFGLHGLRSGRRQRKPRDRLGDDNFNDTVTGSKSPSETITEPVSDSASGFARSVHHTRPVAGTAGRRPGRSDDVRAPILAGGPGWTVAKDLRPGDRLLGRDVQPTPIEAVRDTGEVAAVYNLRIAEYHTYFVGGLDWGFSIWAHNACRIVELNPGVEMTGTSGEIRTTQAIELGRQGENIAAGSAKEARQVAEAISPVGRVEYDCSRSE